LVARESWIICARIPEPQSSRAPAGNGQTVEGHAEILGPDDPHPGVDAQALRILLRDIFRSAGGTHDDWDTYDRVMAEERRAAVLVSPRRTYTNPTPG
jgi:hypothetical protein